MPESKGVLSVGTLGFSAAFNLQRVILTFWVGGMWAVGYLVVPELFKQLPSTQMAGSMAGSLFLLLGQAGLICTLILLVLYFLIDQSKWRFAVLLLIAALIATNLYILTPEIAALRETAGDALQKGTEIYSKFALLHGIASGLFLL
ncbi:MAG: DUF4149 domain-containing protein, partial [Gammaproteobacteria bacterium]|nr:DUF4149 domain-containing protein [Gammaproteobacteria bacterium]